MVLSEDAHQRKHGSDPRLAVLEHVPAHAGTVWYVATDGDNTNGGKDPTDPLATLGEAFTRASDGDVIQLGPGTFNEALDARTKQLTFRGSGFATVLTHDGTAIEIPTGTACATLALGSNSVVESMKIVNTFPAGVAGMAICAYEKSNITIRNVWAYAPLVNHPIHARDSTNVRIDRTLVEGEYGIGFWAASASDQLMINNCRIIVDMTASHEDMALIAINGNCLVRNSFLLALRSHESQYGQFNSVAVQASGGTVLLQNCALEACAVNYGTPKTVWAINGANITLAACRVASAGEAQLVHDLYVENGRIAVTQTQYDPVKTSGTIVNLDQRAVEDALDEAIPASPTGDSVNERIKAIDERTEAGLTIGDITTAPLTKFVTEDTGETAAADGSFAKLAQG